ncbi:MAG: DUF1223 domain-containing protein [Dongiaceae bacterium]
MLPRLLSLGFMLSLFPGLAVAAAERPVVIELFTSQGCSSCPPADAFLTDLSHNRPDVLPLAFHVTYWNDLGWKDPFSLDAATQRQSRYGMRFGDGSYTPEIVVDGVKDLVGSDRVGVEAAIQQARQESQTAAPISIRQEGGQIFVQVAAGSGSGQVLLIGFDHERRTAVGRGENSGRMLIESNIVRSIRPIGQWSGALLQLSVPVPDGQEIAVILEAPDGRIVGASRLDGST